MFKFGIVRLLTIAYSFFLLDFSYAMSDDRVCVYVCLCVVVVWGAYNSRMVGAIDAPIFITRKICQFS